MAVAVALNVIAGRSDDGGDGPASGATATPTLVGAISANLWQSVPGAYGGEFSDVR